MLKLPLLLYDGECGLCDAFARWLLRRCERRNKELYFATLQGRSARVVLENAGFLSVVDGNFAADDNHVADDCRECIPDSLVFLPATPAKNHAANSSGQAGANAEALAASQMNGRSMEGKMYHLRTDGVIMILDTLGGGWRVFARVLRIIPRNWRDSVYRCVARVRRQIFGSLKPGDGVANDPRWASRFLP